MAQQCRCSRPQFDVLQPGDVEQCMVCGGSLEDPFEDPDLLDEDLALPESE